MSPEIVLTIEVVEQAFLFWASGFAFGMIYGFVRKVFYVASN